MQTTSQESCVECNNCPTRFKFWAVILSLVLCLVCGIIGILGSSESLVALGLYLLYQGFVSGKSIVDKKELPKVARGDPVSQWTSGRFRQDIRLVGLTVGIILILGLLDVFIFSIVRMIKGGQGIIVFPSPYSACAAVVCILSSYIFYRYSRCINQRFSNSEGVRELTRCFRGSIIIACISLIGILLTRWGWLYGDALAGIISGLVMIKPTINLLRQNIRVSIA